MWGGQFGVKPI